MTNEEPLNRFESTKVTPEGLAKIMQFREAFKALDELVSMPNLYPTTINVYMGIREQSLARTNLEQACMWAIKAVSHYNVQEDEAPKDTVSSV